jgi:hypothetical protein
MMAIISRVVTPREFNAPASRSMVGTSSTTENLPLVSVTLVCVVGVTAVWPPASALGYETFKVEAMETVSAP